MSTIVDADTLLAIDVGSVNTRASLFDVVDGRYRFVATGRSASTADYPVADIGEGIRLALERVQGVTGRRLIDESDSLIVPASADGSGTDVFVATASAGPSLRTIMVGLMPGVSIESARRLATGTYLNVLDEIGLTDRRREEEQIDLLLRAKPDLILLVGGTDGGANESVLRMVDLVAVAASLFPEGEVPRVVYAGNRQLSAAVADRLGDQLPLVLTPNVRPTLGTEDLAPARLRLAEVIGEVRSMRISGFEELRQWTGGNLMLTADAVGRVCRYLSQVYDPEKGVMGVDLGASHTTVAAAFAGDLRLTVCSDLGLGAALPGLLRHSSLEKVTRWLPIDIPDEYVQDYVYNKAHYPRSVPAETEEMHLEYALARQLIRSALFQARAGWPQGKDSESVLLMPPLEPIIASGGALARAPRPGLATLVLLDALQPTGVCTLILDPHNLSPALGAAAEPLPLVAVQVLGSGGFVSLGTVVAPIGRARQDRPVLKFRLDKEGTGDVVEDEVRFGQLVVLSLGQGEHGRLTLRPEQGFDLGFGGPGKAGALRVSGGAVGLIIDARGRPLQLARDGGRRRELNQKWLWDIGALH
ncbi:MAG: hypothetical protein A2Z37_06050 [Chloroflexi bacterium RBG_19FT_COMBO_62_14]|nr:MAG: hypothetical protein A2Z37_06050 [Chloroflexi bacterium RBG_19FT_COMBO_62_14]